MNFLTNILRYPRFFISSVLGLSLVLVTPFLKLFKEMKDKRLFLLLLVGCIASVFFILNLMMNPSF
jgi:uncharacterized membrane protein